MSGLSDPKAFNQAMKTWTDSWAGDAVSYGRVHYTVTWDPEVEDKTTYEDVLRLNEGCMDEQADLADIAIAREAGDEELAILLGQELALGRMIEKHCKARLEALERLRQAYERPGVMIPAWSETAFMGVNREPYDPKPPLTTAFDRGDERNCTQCSKTCDVGQACWWCGSV